MGCNCGTENKNSEDIKKMLSKYTKDRSNLIQVLNEVQETYGYMPKFAQLEIAKYLEMTMAEVYGVITFYSRFTLEPKGKYNVAVCMGTACFVKGAEKLVDRLKEKLNIETGETTEDGHFSIEATRCIGACGLAPVLTVNEDVYGKATVETIDKILIDYKDK